MDFNGKISLLLIAVLLMLGPVAHAQVYVSDYSAGKVGMYDAQTGAPINANLITGLGSARGIALDNAGHLYVASHAAGNNGIVGEYDAATGAAINPTIISGIGDPEAVALDGKGNLFVASFSGPVKQYNATTGALINASVASMVKPFGMTADGNGHLFMTDYNQGRVAAITLDGSAPTDWSYITGLRDPEKVIYDGAGHLVVLNYLEDNGLGIYDAATGAAINAGLSDWGGSGLAIDRNGGIFVSTFGTVRKFDSATGDMIDGFSISGFTSPDYLAAGVPEPSMLVMATMAMVALASRTWRG